MSIHTNLKPGDMFGRYRLESFLGAGGFAVVWKAYDTKTNIVVALKSSPHLTLRASMTSRPNIVRYMNCRIPQ